MRSFVDEMSHRAEFPAVFVRFQAVAPVRWWLLRGTVDRGASYPVRRPPSMLLNISLVVLYFLILGFAAYRFWCMDRRDRDDEME